MAALLLDLGSLSPLLLHLLLSSLFTVIPGSAAGPCCRSLRSHPAPGDTQSERLPDGTLTGALAGGNWKIHPARTIQGRRRKCVMYEQCLRSISVGIPSYPWCPDYRNSTICVSEPTPHTGRCHHQPAWSGGGEKGVVSPVLESPVQYGKKRTIQRTRAYSRIQTHRNITTDRVVTQSGHLELVRALFRVQLYKSKTVDVKSRPNHCPCHSKQELTAARRPARALSKYYSYSNLACSVSDANKLDKATTDRPLSGPLNVIDLSTEGLNGFFKTGFGNTRGCSEPCAQHLSPSEASSCLESHRITESAVVCTGCSERHPAWHRTDWHRFNISLKRPVGMSCAVCGSQTRENTKITFSYYNLIFQPVNSTAHANILTALECDKSERFCSSKSLKRTDVGKTAEDLMPQADWLDGISPVATSSETRSNDKNAHYHRSSEMSAHCLDANFSDERNSESSPTDTAWGHTPSHLYLLVELNFTKRSGDSHYFTRGCYRSECSRKVSAPAAQWTAPSAKSMNFTETLILWNFNSNNNCAKKQHNTNSSSFDGQNGNVAQNDSASEENDFTRKESPHHPSSNAQRDSAPVENPRAEGDDYSAHESLTADGGAARPQLKSGKRVSLQAEGVSQAKEQLEADPECGRRAGQREGGVKGEERGEGDRKPAQREGEESMEWVIAEDTKEDSVNENTNLPDIKGKDENKNTSHLENEENKEWHKYEGIWINQHNKKQYEGESDEAQTRDGQEFDEVLAGVPPVGRSRRAANRHPQFSQYNYQVQVAENQPHGTSVIAITADDPDAGEAGRLSYIMAPLMNSRSMDYFQIDQITGLLKTTQILDREYMDLHYFRITATDHGSPHLSATTMVTINVADRNDHSPVFEQTEYRETIRENVEEGYPILQLRATDLDSPANANIRYRFVGESAAVARSAFEIDPRSGLITTRGIIDREANERYTLLVEASDQGREPGPRSATVSVHITVLDENDNVPQFSQKRYVVAVREDVRPHSEILRVTASDLDKDVNAAVHYNIISGNSRGQFAIDSVTGEIQVVAPLDFETEREYTLRLRAQDNGRPPLSNNTGIVSVQVTDVNDNPPIFVSTPFQATVLESAPIGHSILHIQAIDTDNGDNARLEYRLTGTGSDTPFVINAATGWVTVRSELDRESVEHYFFGVEARDYGATPLSATASITITVMDVNDNRPEFLQKEYYVRLNEDAAVGTSVVSVTAVDRDVNSAVTYQITGGNTRNRFAISTAGGAGLVSLALPLDYKQERRYVLTVTASDRTLHDTCQVHVNITDANTHRPVFQSAHYSVSVNEDRPPGSTVVVISATDEDVGENARITYYLEDNIPQFRIDPGTGAITLHAELDYEDQMTYTLAITARDNGIPQKSDTTYVEVNVNDVNDNAPQFLSPRYQGGVSEDAPPFTSVLQISATDRDAHANGRVQYTFQNGEDGDGDFTIEPTSGIVRTVRRLDRESVPFYELTAYAVDRGVPPQRTPVHIQVSVMDVNDNAPVFPADDFEVLVKENSAVGSVVAQITATDPDEGPNAQIMYQIVEGNIPEIFQMDIFSGELTSLIDLDYETRNEYVIVVQATSAPLVSRATVRIRLVDQNDNGPQMQDFQIIFNNFVSNRSNTFPSGVIGRVPAHDPDVSDRLYYTIDRGNELHLLLLNHTSGEIRLSRKLDNNRPLVAPMLITVTGKTHIFEKQEVGGG
ncbi:Cadherin EGF LAG seven-pass G-type receptor 3 [Triplophysa tibetana]|uniref:Cadherin EGF LAG seven-pass G-type receptor 3 n=1 Tax=Triplophysa tibetana TaxID=1572043 RepID=A0A5A9NY45_9TELE|nr:Cadherin EGF LAG seven-pass G-type receptor 3 [Triplophysa tibetana]